MNDIKNVYLKNFEILKKRFPALARKIEGIEPGSVKTARTQDGGYCYVVLEAGQMKHFSNAANPVAAAKQALANVDSMLSAGSSPALVAGLSPGYLLEAVYNGFAKQKQPRRIYQIVDIPECLAGWLGMADRSRILSDEMVEFFWHEEIDEIARLCESDESRSHAFIPVSSILPERFNKMMEPLIRLSEKRDSDSEKWQRENEEYYYSLTNEQLKCLFSGEADRKPRLLMPADLSSTVARFSARDACAAFEKKGWESRILPLSGDLSAWRMIKSIHEFKPDALVFIGHLRTENSFDPYPKNMMFVSWIQDTLPWINNREAAEKWNFNAYIQEDAPGQHRRRDIIAGYTEQLENYGYQKKRIINIPMIVNRDFFRGDIISSSSEKYSCALCFASNRSKAPEKVLEEEIIPEFSSYGFKPEALDGAMDRTLGAYNSGTTFTSVSAFRTFLNSEETFKSSFEMLPEDMKNSAAEYLFWNMNDLVYRFTVLEWCAALDIDMKLYGRGWEKNPVLGKYAAGCLEHGSELAEAYRSAVRCLHLNSMEGAHQRLSEIIAAGACPLTRKSRPDFISQELAGAFRKTACLLTDFEAEPFTEPEKKALHESFVAFALTCKKGCSDLCVKLALKWFSWRLAGSVDWLFEDWSAFCFDSRGSLTAKLALAPERITGEQSRLLCSVNDLMTAGKIIEAMKNLCSREPLEGNKKLLSILEELVSFEEIF